MAMQLAISNVLVLAIGLSIFIFYLYRGGQNRSLEATMELGLIITLLAGSLLYAMNPLIHVAIFVAGIITLLRKGFV
ncbi:MAG: hypothetical protein ACRED0_01310 [Gammaproteobacteria bacterium]